jgi:hypothetical protein
VIRDVSGQHLQVSPKRLQALGLGEEQLLDRRIGGAINAIHVTVEDALQAPDAAQPHARPRQNREIPCE